MNRFQKIQPPRFDRVSYALDKFLNQPCKYTKLTGEASITRENPSSPYYEIMITARTENRVEDETNSINHFHTGLILAPPVGYYTVLYPNPLLVNSGYMMNPVIIHPEFRDEIIVSLYKVAEGQDLDLPYPAVFATFHQSNVTMMIQCNGDVDCSITGDSMEREEKYSEDRYGAPIVPKKKKKAGMSSSHRKATTHYS